MAISKFWKGVLSSDDNTSSKRVVTLIISAFYIIASFTILFLVCYLVVVTPKGTVNKDLLDVLSDILQNSMFIILSGLGFIGLENWGVIQLEKAKARADSSTSTGMPSSDNTTIENLTVTPKTEGEEDIK